jgi:Flp pilus assembly protein TadD
MERSDLERAERLMRKTLESHEGDPVLWNDLALILWRREKWREAEKAFESALVLEPLYEDAKMNLASLLASRGFYRQALRLEEEILASKTPRRPFHEQKTAEYREAIARLDAQEPPETPAPPPEPQGEEPC